MNFWTIVAVGFSALFLVASLFTLGGKGAINKLVCLFVFLAAICCDVYLAYNQNTLPALVRLMFLMLFLFQLFVFIVVMFKHSSPKRGYYR